MLVQEVECFFTVDRMRSDEPLDYTTIPDAGLGSANGLGDDQGKNDQQAVTLTFSSKPNRLQRDL